MSGRYLGHLKVELEHGPSGAKITTAAPVDNQGDGSSFSPTDLCAASLGACMLTVMGIVAERDGIDFSTCRFTLEKHMQTDPRRIAKPAARPSRCRPVSAPIRARSSSGPPDIARYTTPFCPKSRSTSVSFIPIERSLRPTFASRREEKRENWR